MNRYQLAERLKPLVKRAVSLRQFEAAREIEALIHKLGAQYYFLVQPGGYSDLIPDNEYQEFESEEAVVEYVQDTLFSEDSGASEEELEILKDGLSFEEARKTLLELGEFGELARPLVPPNTMVGAENRYADLSEVKEELEERFERWKYDPRLKTVVFRILQMMTPEGRAQLLAEALPVLIDKAMETYESWKQEGREIDLESPVGDNRESAFYKEVLPPSDEEEEDHKYKESSTIDERLERLKRSDPESYWRDLIRSQKPLKDVFTKDEIIQFAREGKLQGANLSGMDLSKADLSGADLTGSILSGANLEDATLIDIDLREAKLSGAILAGAFLHAAILTGADFSGANLAGANLGGANLVGANLSGADLLGADLIGADLTGADLNHAILIEARLAYATLTGAKLEGTELLGATYKPSQLRRTIGTPITK